MKEEDDDNEDQHEADDGAYRLQHFVNPFSAEEMTGANAFIARGSRQPTPQPRVRNGDPAEWDEEFTHPARRRMMSSHSAPTTGDEGFLAPAPLRSSRHA